MPRGSEIAFIIEGLFKSSKPYTERKAIFEYFHSGQHALSLFIKLISDFCLNFCAGEAHTKLREKSKI